MVDVIYSPNIRELARLFAPPAQAYGRPVAIIRHPIERALAKFEYLKEKDENVKGMTLEAFATSGESAFALTTGNTCKVPRMFLLMHAAFSCLHTLTLTQATSKITF